ncbi:MgtC/SapB family protein [Phenylobacterium sp.]|uniref:MgtC/SapB family protein n=1 Tax=Phenylobacterium sp. TaxID=1871053 RepID=UPI0026237469|nr:MgtC/SapB family protein [Phenylobacterium sp.]
MLAQWELVLRLVLAAALGGAIGWERERLLWAAGLRTHMLVSLGACLAMIVSAYAFQDVLGAHVVLDPSRVAAQVVSGIGFLGAGMIIFRNEAVKGLTTAASVWAVAGVGLAAGSGLYTAAVAATLIMLVILAGLKPIEEQYRATHASLDLRILGRRGELSAGVVEGALGPRSSRIKRLVLQPSEGGDEDEIRLVLSRVSPKDTAELIRSIENAPAVLSVEEARSG